MYFQKKSGCSYGLQATHTMVFVFLIFFTGHLFSILEIDPQMYFLTYLSDVTFHPVLNFCELTVKVQ